jgi:hypothetical protein
MLEVARAEAARAGLANVAFEQADAQVHPFAPESFDLVLSRTAATQRCSSATRRRRSRTSPERCDRAARSRC